MAVKIEGKGPLRKFYCKRCGCSFPSQKFNVSKFCDECKSIIEENRDGAGYYKTAAGKTIFLHNGLEILNNAMGKEIANKI